MDRSEYSRDHSDPSPPFLSRFPQLAGVVGVSVARLTNLTLFPFPSIQQSAPPLRHVAIAIDRCFVSRSITRKHPSSPDIPIIGTIYI